MNKSLAIVKAREVCRVHRFSSTEPWCVLCPTDLRDPMSEVSKHPCDSYTEAVQWCAQAVARVALNLVRPDLRDDTRKATYSYMRDNQMAGFVSSVQEILRLGLQYVEHYQDGKSIFK